MALFSFKANENRQVQIKEKVDSSFTTSEEQMEIENMTLNDIAEIDSNSERSESSSDHNLKQITLKFRRKSTFNEKLRELGDIYRKAGPGSVNLEPAFVRLKNRAT